MARLSILDRFRPVGAPGPAGPTGVPAADAQGPAVELVPVFEALAIEVHACGKRIEEARFQAEHEVATARTQAAEILSRARLEAGAARANAAAKVEEEAKGRDALLLEQAHQEAAKLEASGLALIPGFIDKAIDSLFAMQDDEEK
jgi:vacuolar-type H+-ATPase subunit H